MMRLRTLLRKQASRHSSEAKRGATVTATQCARFDSGSHHHHRFFSSSLPGRTTNAKQQNDMEQDETMIPSLDATQYGYRVVHPVTTRYGATNSYAPMSYPLQMEKATTGYTVSTLGVVTSPSMQLFSASYLNNPEEIFTTTRNIAVLGELSTQDSIHSTGITTETRNSVHDECDQDDFDAAYEVDY